MDRGAEPKTLYDALVERYYDPEQGYGKGKYADFWEPIPFSRYLNPSLFYEPPQTVLMTATRQQCVDCHTGVSPGWVHSWGASAHTDLDQIRQLPDDDPRAYKKDRLAEVERNLRSLGKLAEDVPLKEVGCIDCHVSVGATHGDHAKDLRLPDAAVCGACHLQEFAERESERDTLDWPQDQWPKGRPSHALDYHANVETAIWAAMPQREVAEGCTMCHTNQNSCTNCHSRHEFSVEQARKPEACSVCHNGVDHNEYENYLLSKHGILYKTLGHSVDWSVPVADSMAAGQSFPTCQSCHMEYRGKFSHNMVQKVRWAFNPTPAIADNLDHPWFEERRGAWVATCSTCHSVSFANAYLELMDEGIKQGLIVEQDAKKVIEQLHADGLLPGQESNRPAPPAPEEDAPGGFFQLFWAKGNNPSAVEREYAEMWEQDLIKHYKGLAHVNPGGWTYTDGWSQLLKRTARINDADTQLREMAALKADLADLKAAQTTAWFSLDTPAKQASFGALGMILLGLGVASVASSRRRTPSDRS
ncbi:multiheme c-type cytochrome [Thioalkalicoccus limnaeus]|uniref:Hydroxylamine oxidoreductase n=1 Tax=Thioalkalicoccus limnaeus TaxID=120681 RepID=A0ABV4BI57_9GAMM